MNIPGYTIKSELGRGAMASVYLAVQESLDRQVALKVMSPSLSSDPTFCERFIKEGRIVAKLAHPHVVTIFDIAQAGEHYFMAMEYIGGGTLSDRLGRPIPIKEAIAITKQLASALSYAHKRGFVHRDVKPANVLFRDNGTAVLSDFGIAKALDNRTQMTAAGSIVGTPSYMSPEQALGKPVDHRSDLYSLGIVLFEMLTGNKPYQADDMFATALMHVNAPIPRLPAYVAELQPIIDTLLAKDPQARFQSAQGVVEALDMEPAEATRVISSIAARPTKHEDTVLMGTYRSGSVPGTQGGGDATKRTRIVLALAAVSLVGASGSAIWWWIANKNGQGKAESTGQQAMVQPTTSVAKLPVVKAPPLTAETLNHIVNLLKAAEAHMMVERLVDPPGSNAFDAYKEVLQLDPNNEQAEQGIRAIADFYQEKAQALWREGKLKESQEQIVLGLGVMPNHVGLKELQRAVTTKPDGATQ